MKKKHVFLLAISLLAAFMLCSCGTKQEPDMLGYTPGDFLASPPAFSVCHALSGSRKEKKQTDRQKSIDKETPVCYKHIILIGYSCGGHYEQGNLQLHDVL